MSKYIVSLSLVAQEVFGTTAQWAALCQLRHRKWKSFELTICTCLCNGLSEVCAQGHLSQLSWCMGLRLHASALRESNVSCPPLLFWNVKLPPPCPSWLTLCPGLSHSHKPGSTLHSTQTQIWGCCAKAGNTEQKPLFFGCSRANHNLVSHFCKKNTLKGGGCSILTKSSYIKSISCLHT